MTDLARLICDAQEAFETAADSVALENAKARFLGKSGQLTERLKALSQVDAEARKTLGAEINAAKTEIEALLQRRRQQIADAARDGFGSKTALKAMPLNSLYGRMVTD